MAVSPKIVIFDFGNVLLRWDPNFLYEKLIPDENERQHFLTQICSPEWNMEQDRGRPWNDAVSELVAQHPDKEDLIRAFYDRWHETLPGAIDGSVAILETLKAQKTPLYAITNFSVEKLEECKSRFPFLATSFRDIVVSGEVELLKPDPKIYQILTERNALDTSDCIFIDDSPANVATANSLGITGLHFTTPERLAADLTALGLSV